MRKSRNPFKFVILVFLALFTLNTAVMYVLFGINVFRPAGQSSVEDTSGKYGYSPYWKTSGEVGNTNATGSGDGEGDGDTRNGNSGNNAGLNSGAGVGGTGSGMGVNEGNTENNLDSNSAENSGNYTGSSSEGNTGGYTGETENGAVSNPASKADGTDVPGSTGAGAGINRFFPWIRVSGTDSEDKRVYLTGEQVKSLEKIDIADKFAAVAILSKVDGKETDNIIKMAEDGVTYSELQQIEKLLQKYLTAAEIEDLKGIIERNIKTQ